MMVLFVFPILSHLPLLTLVLRIPLAALVVLQLVSITIVSHYRYMILRRQEVSL